MTTANTKIASRCRVYLIRHGEVLNAREPCFNGHYDIALSPRGIDQVQKVAEALEGKPVSKVYSSDLQRAYESARIVGKPRGQEPVAFPELREICMGLWEGLTAREVDRRYPGELERRLKDVETFCAEGGETFAQLQDRVIPKFQEIVGNHPGDSVVVVAHGGVNRVILSRVLGLPARHIFRIRQDYATVNIIQYRDGDSVVELMNGSPNSLP
ncbi:MAG: histidine phosphatase family protein [Nitrospinae bacterium]|nr:histidine phosphatase family protein [Nitrospinota bacterium]